MTKMSLLIMLISACSRAEFETPSLSFIKFPKEALASIKLIEPQVIVDHRSTSRFGLGWIRSDMLQHFPLEIRQKIQQLDPSLESVDFDIDSSDEDTVGGPLAREGYHDYEQLSALMLGLQEKCSPFMRLHSAGKSVEGRDLWMMKIADVQSSSEEPTALLIANMHGNEVVGRELMLKLLEHLCVSYDHDQQIRDLVKHSQIWIMPSMNPDGFERGSRFNADGYDLNRWFPDFTDEDPNTTDGRPPEVQAVMKLFQENRFDLAINFHGGELCVNIPWDSIPNADPRHRYSDDRLMYDVAREYADLHPTMHDNHRFDRGVTYGFEWANVFGTMQDWSAAYYQVPHATLELTKNYWPPYSTVDTYWADHQQSILRYLQRTRIGVALEIKSDATSFKVLPKDGSSRSFSNTRIFVPTALGQQQLIIQAQGHADTIIDTSAQLFLGSFRPIELSQRSLVVGSESASNDE